MTLENPEFFVTGKILPPNAPSYVKRPADEILLKLVTEGELCYVINTRQMGKSSLLVRIIHRLKEIGEPIRIVHIDLPAIGITTVDKWYYSLINEISYQLNITIDIQIWWQENCELEAVSRFTRFFRNVVLNEVKGRIAIFIDEVDFVKNFTFSDDFFAVIRALYNKRTIDQSFGRIAFILVGALAPHDLIESHTRTPFNVGQWIKLDELNLKNAEVLLEGLPKRNASILKRIFYWTDGHPYLIQKIGQAITTEPGDVNWPDERIDSLVKDLFLTDKALLEDSNLQFIHNRILSSDRKDRLLNLYRRIYQKKNGLSNLYYRIYQKEKVANSKRSALQNELILSGLVKVDDKNHLIVRNRIYEKTFDQKWIKENQPINKWRLAALGAIVMLILTVGTFGFISWWFTQPDVLVINAIRVNRPLVIDGRLEDEAWAQVQPFTFATHPSANDSTTAEIKILYDDQFLYVGFDVNDTQVEGSIKPLRDGDSVSMIIETEAGIKEYRHSLIGVDDADTEGDSYSKHYLKETTTFNDISNEDVGYTVEMLVPLPIVAITDDIVPVDFLSVDHDQNPGGSSDDPQTISSKVSWDGDENVETAKKNIQLSNTCSDAKIISVRDSLFPDYAAISWEPANCIMTVEYFLDGELQGKHTNVVSGEEINVGNAEVITIFKDGFPQSRDSILVQTGASNPKILCTELEVNTFTINAKQLNQHKVNLAETHSFTTQLGNEIDEIQITPNITSIPSTCYSQLSFEWQVFNIAQSQFKPLPSFNNFPSISYQMPPPGKVEIINVYIKDELSNQEVNTFLKLQTER